MVFQMPMESFDPAWKKNTQTIIPKLYIYPVSEVYQTGQQIEQKCLKRFYS